MDDKGSAGFTLVELLITLAIVAIVAEFALPAVSRFIDRARVGAAAEALLNELRQARHHALTRHRTVYFSVIPGSGRWCYGWGEHAGCDCRFPEGDRCNGDTPNDPPFHRRSSDDYPSVALRTARHPPVELRFRALRGTATAASFDLQGRHAARRVIVSPLGRVRSCDPEVDGDIPC